MKMTGRVRWLVLAGLVVVVVGLAIVGSNQSDDSTVEAELAPVRDPDVPELPFADNLDPSQCGIPSQWSGDARAWLNGYYENELIQPVVFLYNSHSRLSITAQAPHGSEVEIILFQDNPVVDYYMVKVVGLEGPNEGWIPAPFLSFDPVQPLPKDADNVDAS
jgi:hypothetical protein